MASDKKKSASAKRVWERIRKVAQERGITVQEARVVLAAENQSNSNLEKKPMNNATTLEKPTTKPKAEPKAKVVDLHAAEVKLREKYPHIVPGTLKLPAEGSKKRSVEITCQHPGCSARRRVYTSDLFQVKFCTEHTRSRRKAKESKD